MNVKSELSTILVAIGKNTKKLRLEKRITQQELAYRCDMDKSGISNIERFNYSNITIGTLIKISMVLECNIVDLMK